MSVGLSFAQQIRAAESTPDALITQVPLKIFIETKQNSHLDLGQLKAHIRGIAEKDKLNCVMLGIAPHELSKKDSESIQSFASKHGVRFKSVTFTDILQSLEDACEDYENSLRAIVDDYASYLDDEGVLPDRDAWLAAFPCGTSYAENERFGVYYEPTSRPSKAGCRFLGIYRRTSISLIGDIKAILNVENGKAVEQELASGNKDDLKRVREVVANTPYYDLDRESHRFYLVDHFHSTDFGTSSRSGLRGYRRFNLRNFIGEKTDFKKMSVKDVAEQLKGKHF